jgi:hypothetical protein
MTQDGEDSVETGIREWRKTKADAEAAIERARVAEGDATFVRGQLEVLAQQKAGDDNKIRALQAHVAEMELLVDTLGSAVLSILEKRKAGTFRRAGSVQNGNDRIAAVRGGAGDENGSDQAPGEPARSLDLGKLERDIAEIPKINLRGPKA